MRRFALILMVLAVPCAVAAPAFAATQTAISTSAPPCRLVFVTTTGVNFGNVTYAPDGGSATGDVTVNCTNGLRTTLP